MSNPLPEDFRIHHAEDPDGIIKGIRAAESGEKTRWIGRSITYQHGGNTYQLERASLVRFLLDKGEVFRYGALGRRLAGEKKLLARLDKVLLTDFPNYFACEKGEEKQRETQISNCFNSVLQRIAMPYKNQEGQEVNTDILKAVKSKLPTGAKAYISGGVCSSLLGYLYQEIHQAHKEQKQVKRDKDLVNETLNRIASDSKRIPAFDALGIAGDFKILIDFPKEIPSDKKQAALEEIKNLINSAREGRETIAPIGDAQEYKKHMEDLSLQGGSSLDLMAFSITEDHPSSGDDSPENIMQDAHKIFTEEPSPNTSFRMPEDKTSILTDFFSGMFDFIEPKISQETPTPLQQHATVVNVLRPLLEIPSLQLKKAGRVNLKERVKFLSTENKKDSQAEQVQAVYAAFTKNLYFGMTRNQRFQAANKFATATKPDALETKVRALSRQYVRKITRYNLNSAYNFPLIPEYTSHKRAVAQTTPEDLGSINRLLMDSKAFIEKHTDNGTLYHGTPRAENMLAMLRGGMAVSNDDRGAEQGAALFGKGAYTTPDKAIASKYATPDGFILNFRVKKDVPVRVLNLDKLTTTNRNSLEKRAQKENMSLHEYLAKKCNVDIIIRTHVLVLNQEVLEVPQNGLALAIETPFLLYLNGLESYQAWFRSYGSRAKPSFEEIVDFHQRMQFLLKIKKKFSPFAIEVFANKDKVIKQLQEFTLDTLNMSRKLFQNPYEKNAYTELSDYDENYKERYAKFVSLIKDFDQFSLEFGADNTQITGITLLTNYLTELKTIYDKYSGINRQGNQPFINNKPLKDLIDDLSHHLGIEDSTSTPPDFTK